VLADLDTSPPPDLVAAAMVAAAGTARPAGPWRRALAEHGDARVGDGRVTIGERAWEATVRFDGQHAARITLDGIERRYTVVVADEAVWVARDGHHLEVRTATVSRDGAGAHAGSLEAPMPGTVLLVPVADGDHVAEGDVLVVIESMKMELSIVAPRPGTVAGLELKPGDRVSFGQPLVAVVEPEEVAA
jgi:acetyl-CoA/propionyl-CoA carboxylase biotin carboxyl carrier protein